MTLLNVTTIITQIIISVRRTWTVQWYSSGGANVHPSLSLGPPKSSNGISIGSAVFAQLTAEGPYTIHGGSGPRLIYTSLGSPTQHPKWHLNRFSHFCTTRGKQFLYFTMGSPCLSPQNCPFPWGIWTNI